MEVGGTSVKNKNKSSTVGKPLLYIAQVSLELTAPKIKRIILTNFENEDQKEQSNRNENIVSSAVEEVTDQKVKTAFFKVGETKIELLETMDPEGPIGKFLEKKGPGIHHIAFAVDQVDEALAEAEISGIQLVDKKGRKGAEGLNIGFLHPKSTFGVLTELCSE